MAAEPEAIEVPVTGGRMKVWRWREGQPKPTILALHGFTGSGLDFEALVDRLSGLFDIVAPDLPGHGGTKVPLDEAGCGIPATHRQLDAVVDALELRDWALLGYSMGGRVALSYALSRKRLPGKTALVGATAGIDAADHRQQRAKQDRERAERIERGGVAAFVKKWWNLPLISTQYNIPEPYLSRLRERRASNTAEGLSASLRHAGTGTMEPLWGDLHRLSTPVLLAVGSEDAKFRDIAERMYVELPDANSEIIPRAGHCAHLEQPDLFCLRLTEFLNR